MTIRWHLPNLNTYYKGGGGGYQQQPYTPTVQEESTARIEEARANNQIAIDNEERERVRKADERAGRVTTNTGRLGSMRTAAENYGRNQLAAKGLDTSSHGIWGQYQDALNAAAGGVDLGAESISDPFSTSGFDTAYNTARTGERGKYRNELNQFAGTGFENKAFADTADDVFLDAILNEQRGSANEVLDRAYARGQINDYGKKYGQEALDTAQRGGRAKAEDLGLGVLQGYRNQLTNEKNRIGKAVDEYDFGQDLNLAGEKTNLEGLTGRLGSRLEGDILNAVGGTEFFDTGTILGKAGTKSGVVNNTMGAATTNAAGGVGAGTPLGTGKQDEEEANRVGTQGSF